MYTYTCKQLQRHGKGKVKTSELDPPTLMDEASGQEIHAYKEAAKNRKQPGIVLQVVIPEHCPVCNAELASILAYRLEGFESSHTVHTCERSTTYCVGTVPHNICIVIGAVFNTSLALTQT